MKQCTSIIPEEYDGELLFSITEYDFQPNALEMILGAKDGEELVGFKVRIPVAARRLGFKAVNLIQPSGVLEFSSIGEKSDRLIASLAKYLNPSFEPTEGFSEESVEVDYKLRNQGAYDLNQDKIYLKLFYDEEQDEGLPLDERIHLNMNLAFNLSRETASLIEMKEGYSADLIAFLMK